MGVNQRAADFSTIVSPQSVTTEAIYKDSRNCASCYANPRVANWKALLFKLFGKRGLSPAIAACRHLSDRMLRRARGLKRGVILHPELSFPRLQLVNHL